MKKKQRKPHSTKKGVRSAGGKQKTYGRAKKRVRLTGTGLVKVEKPCRNHLLNQKSKGQKAKGKHPRAIENNAEVKRIKKLLPGSF